MTNLMPLVVVLSWLAVPVGRVCIVDDWLLRPRRPPGAADSLPLGSTARSIP